MENDLYLESPVRCIISGKSAIGKSTLLVTLLFIIIDDFDKIFIYSPTIHQPVYRTKIKSFNIFFPLNVIQNILRENIPLDELDKRIEEIITHEDFRSSHLECESYENIDKIKNAQDYDSDIHNVIILNHLNNYQLNDERVLMLFKRSGTEIYQFLL